MPVAAWKRPGALVAWTNAWLDGQVGVDEVVDAVTGHDARHQVRASPGAADEPQSLGEVLQGWRRRGDRVRLVLPAAGDVRGLPGPAGFRDAALHAGSAVVGTGPTSHPPTVAATGYLHRSLVPTVQTHGPSSAPPSVVWHCFDTEPAPPDPIQVADAQYELTTAIRETASALAAADVAGRADPDSVRDTRWAGADLSLPRGFPQRAVALLAQAARTDSVLRLALADPAGGAVDRFGMAARDSALRPLVVAVRRAMIAGFNSVA